MTRWLSVLFLVNGLWRFLSFRIYDALYDGKVVAGG